MSETPPTSAITYLRQSLNKTGEEQSVAVQRVTNKNRLAAVGINEWTEYKDDNFSATNGKPRPAYQRMLADIEAGKHDGKLLAIDHQDRLGRSVMELLLLQALMLKHDIRLLTQSGIIDPDDDDSEFVMIINAAQGQKEARRKGRRQRAANRYMAEVEGRPWWPSRPFGYDADPDPTTGKWWTVRRDPSTKRIIGVNEIRKHKAEAPLVRQAYRDFNAGSTLRTIAGRWNNAGVKTPRGNRWTGVQVRALLMAARNAGLREYGGAVIGKGTWPAIVTEEVWKHAVNRLQDSTRGTNAPRVRKYLLSGLARCGMCANGWTDKAEVYHVPTDETLGSATSSRGQRQYVCNHCQKIARDGVKLDELVIETVVRRLARSDAAELLLADDDDIDADALREQRQALKDRLKQLGKEFAAAPPEFTKAALADINGKLQEINAKLDDPGKADIFEGVIGAKDVRKAFDKLDLGRQRTIVDALLTVQVNPIGKGTGRIFNPDFIEITWK